MTIWSNGKIIPLDAAEFDALIARWTAHPCAGCGDTITGDAVLCDECEDDVDAFDVETEGDE